jgi:hypothetical protein
MAALTRSELVVKLSFKQFTRWDRKERTGPANCTLGDRCHDPKPLYRLRLWKLELQKFADQSGLCVSVRHFAPGTSSGTRSSTGRKVSAAEMKQVTLQPNKFHGQWNYILTLRAK